MSRGAIEVEVLRKLRVITGEMNARRELLLAGEHISEMSIGFSEPSTYDEDTLDRACLLLTCSAGF